MKVQNLLFTRVAPAWRVGALVLIALSLLAAFIGRAPIAQNPAYHGFADQRQMLGVPNLLDVASNLPFLLIGVAGIAFCTGRRRPASAFAWCTVFGGSALVAFGSACYHWAPGDTTLVWDRLPMTVAFMGLLVALLSEYVDPRLEIRVLAPAVIIGLTSVVWWYVTGDLRPYFAVQFTSLACIPCVMLLFPARYSHASWLLLGLGCYVLAKFAEVFDREIFALSANILSGHSLKHLLAATGLLAVLLMLRKRVPLQRHATPMVSAPASEAE